MAASSYTLPPRCPDALLVSDLPDWCKLVWLAIRKRQGDNETAWAYYEDYGSLCNKSPEMVSKAVGILRREGWMNVVSTASRGKAPVLQTLCPVAVDAAERSEQGSAKGRNVVPAFTGKVGTPFQKGRNTIPERSEQGSAPYKEESGQEPEQESGQGARVPVAVPARMPDTPGLSPWLAELLADAPYRTRVTSRHAPAVAVYIAATGKTPPPMSGFESLMDARIGTDPAALRRWAEVVATWVGTHDPGHVGKVYNLGNVRGMLGAYASSVERDPLAVTTAGPGRDTPDANETHRALLRDLGLSEAEITAQLA